MQDRTKAMLMLALLATVITGCVVNRDSTARSGAQKPARTGAEVSANARTIGQDAQLSRTR